MNHSWILSLPPSLPLVSELKIQSVTLSETYCRAALRSIGEKKQRPGQPARNAQPACRAILSPIRSLRSRETAFNAKTEANEKKSKKKKREKRKREKRGGKKIAGDFPRHAIRKRETKRRYIAEVASDTPGSLASGFASGLLLGRVFMSAAAPTRDQIRWPTILHVRIQLACIHARVRVRARVRTAADCFPGIEYLAFARVACGMPARPIPPSLTQYPRIRCTNTGQRSSTSC